MKKQSSYKALADYSPLYPYFIIPFRRQTIGPLFRYLSTVIKDFFLLQFSVKFKARNIEVIHVDNALDNKVPFVPEKVDIYLDFVNFWIRPLSFILQKMDRKRGLQYCAEYLNAINTCYQEASRMYKFRMSTTYRPPAALFGKFRMIHILDPHLLCVPSLHVAIVVLAYTFFADVFKQEHIPDDMEQKLSQELYAGALQIAETVLYVKQHSVNCIAAALYMMINITKGHYTIESAVSFTQDLFKNSPYISESDQEQIRTHILDMFEQLMLEGCNESDWVDPLKRWIIRYDIAHSAES